MCKIEFCKSLFVFFYILSQFENKFKRVKKRTVGKVKALSFPTAIIMR